MDNFNKVCGAVILLLVLLSAVFTLNTHAEEHPARRGISAGRAARDCAGAGRADI